MTENRLTLRASVAVFAAMIVAASCSGTDAQLISEQGADIGQARAEAYNGPKARIAVNKFTNKAAEGGSQIGTGMGDMMTTALVNSNRYIVLDRQNHGAVMAEQDLGASGRVRYDTAAPIGRMEGAELLVTGAVTAFEPEASGVGGGIGTQIGGNALGLIGLGGKNAYIAIDVKVVDTTTGRILAAATVEGKASSYGGGVGALFTGVPLGVGLGGYKNTPMEKAIRVCIDKAVGYIVSRTPPTFYRY